MFLGPPQPLKSDRGLPSTCYRVLTLCPPLQSGDLGRPSPLPAALSLLDLELTEENVPDAEGGRRRRAPSPAPRPPCPALTCLLRLHPAPPQLKISFSETALETTYQYPSESSVLRELGPEPEAPSAPSAPAAQPDDDDDEEEELQAEPPGGLRSKALLVGECGAAWRPERALRSRRKRGCWVRPGGQQLRTRLPELWCG